LSGADFGTGSTIFGAVVIVVVETASERFAADADEAPISCAIALEHVSVHEIDIRIYAVGLFNAIPHDYWFSNVLINVCATQN
jgi:hypothetical protein